MQSTGWPESGVAAQSTAKLSSADDGGCSLSMQAQFWCGVLRRHPLHSRGLWHPSQSKERAQVVKEQRRVWSMLWGKLYGTSIDAPGPAFEIALGAIEAL